MPEIWFRALVKHFDLPETNTNVRKDIKKSKTKKTKKPNPSYRWYEMTFFTRWTPDSCLTLCIDTPTNMISELQSVLTNDTRYSSLDMADPFAMYVPLLDHIIKMYDDAVWGMRNMVRPIEKVRCLCNQNRPHACN